MKKEEKTRKRAVAMRTLHYYLQAVKKYKWMALGAIIATPIVILIRTTFSSLIFANMIDTVSAGIPNEEIIPTLLPQAILLVLSYVIGSAILGWLRVYWIWKVEIKTNYDLAVTCFNSVCQQSMQFHSDRFSGSLVSQTSRFVNAAERFIDMIVFSILPFISMLTGILVVLFIRIPIFAVALIIFVIAYTAISYFAYRKISDLTKQEAAANNRQTGQLSDSLSNILSVKSYGRESHERHRYANFSRGTYNASMNYMNSTMKRDAAFNVINISIIAIIAAFLIAGVPVFGLSVSTLILIVNYSISVMNELWDVNRIFRDINRVFGDAYEMTQILDAPNLVEDIEGAKDLVVKRGDIEFKDVKFRHADAKEAIFEHFNLRVKPGERIGLVGMSGSGKTTLTKLLLRFADVQDGEVLIDGQNVSDVRQVSLREKIAYVPQETALFHRSIAENIAYGKPDATMKEIVRAAKLANADEFISKMPDGYDTLVGERGLKLSGGQRQRIAIARAILKDAPILVLDEATSALDSESEALIQDALEKLMKGRTSIVVAHRLSTIASLDRIVVLEDGKIIEQGSHAELLEKHGAYDHLWSRQSGAFLENAD